MGGTSRRNSAHWADAPRRRACRRREASRARRPPLVERGCSRTPSAAPLLLFGRQTVSPAVVPPACTARGSSGYGRPG